MTGLRIAPNLSLPIEAVTETFAILAKRGKGKTNTAVVMAEEMIGAGQPVVVIDPVGVWWGLRSSKDGKHEGLPVAILGGDHGDLPLSPTSGTLVAETIVASRAPVVLDLSTLSKTQARRFVTDFLEALYHRNRDAMHVIVDEADLFAPQRATGEVARLLGAMEDLVRRGRARGLGVTLITQRPAALHKDVLTQAEVLIALGMTGPRDVAAIDEWIRLHADEDEAKALKASLPSLPVGTAWVWSPGWLGILSKVKVRARTTFDSSATPKPGERRVTARTMATVDIAALGEQMAALVDEVKANDPNWLRTEIARMVREREAERRELETLRATLQQPQQPTIPPEVHEAAAVFEQGSRQSIARVQAAAAQIAEELTQWSQQVSQQMADLSAALNSTAKVRRMPVPRIAKADLEHQPDLTGVIREHWANGPGAQPQTLPNSTPLPKAQRAILTVLATYGTRPVSSVGNLSGYSSKGGGFRNSLSALRTAGYIEGRGDLTITGPGLAALGPVEPLPTGAGLREHWKSLPAVGGAAAKVIDVLAQAYPAAMPIEQIAGLTGYSPAGGGFRNALSKLRSLGLAHGRGEMTLDADLAD